MMSTDLRPHRRRSAQHVRSVAMTRIHRRTGNVGPAVVSEVREILALLLDL